MDTQWVVRPRVNPVCTVGFWEYRNFPLVITMVCNTGKETKTIRFETNYLCVHGWCDMAKKAC